MPPRLPGLVVFDLDGTLIDSRQDLAAAANELISELGGTPLDETSLAGMIGDGVRLLVERALAAGCGLQAVGDEMVERFRGIYASHLLDHTRPYAGVHPTLEALRRRTLLAVLTNKPQEATLAILRGLDLLPYFRAVVADGSGFARKPQPEALLHLVSLASTEPESSLYVGDSLVDWQTARNAGVAVALARYGYGFAHFPLARLDGDEVLLDEPLDLLRYLGL